MLSFIVYLYVGVVTRVKGNYHVLAYFHLLFIYLVDEVTRYKRNYHVLGCFRLLFIYLVDVVTRVKYH
jgi:hypothetical protein